MSYNMGVQLLFAFTQCWLIGNVAEYKGFVGQQGVYWNEIQYIDFLNYDIDVQILKVYVWYNISLLKLHSILQYHIQTNLTNIICFTIAIAFSVLEMYKAPANFIIYNCFLDVWANLIYYDEIVKIYSIHVH